MSKYLKEWTINKNGIINSIARVIKLRNINKLTKDAYRFVMNISGFIAHYDINGFKHEYHNVADFVKDLQISSDISNPDYYVKDAFFQGEQQAYYTAKSEILQAIAEMVQGLDVIEEDVSYTYNHKVSRLKEAKSIKELPKSND